MVGELKRLMARLWSDDAGSIIATEYMILGTVLTLGSVAGLEALREATVSEMKEYGNSVRNLRQAYGTPTHKVPGATKSGSQGTDASPCVGDCP